MPEASNAVMSFIRSQMDACSEFGRQSFSWFQSQSLARKVCYVCVAFVGLLIGITVLIFHDVIIALMIDISFFLENYKYGSLILFTLVFLVGFPPLLGFSALSMLCGMVYGFPGGWPLLASASVSGSFVSFLVFKFFLRNRAEQLVLQHEKFRAFAEILKEDASLFLLVLLRLCPFPYSLSNGALAAIPNLPASTYLLASIITSPKMFMHIFIGHTIKNLGNAERPTSAKILDVFSILLTGCAVSLASVIIYRKMQQKLDSYHHGGNVGRASFDQLVFGNFDDDPEMGNNLELNLADFDEDNFIIEEENEVHESYTTKGDSVTDPLASHREDSSNYKDRNY